MKGKTFYDPESQPNSAEWLAAPELERIRWVSNFHSMRRLKAGSMKAHAAVHVIVENQLAMGFGPTVRAMARLQGEGLSRHDALHAIGSVVSYHLYAAMSEPQGADSHEVQAQMNADIERLDVETWRKND